MSLLIRGAQRARCQAETPLIALFRFSRPALPISELGRLSRDVFHYALGRLADCRMADKAQASLYEFRGRLILKSKAPPEGAWRGLHSLGRWGAGGRVLPSHPPQSGSAVIRSARSTRARMRAGYASCTNSASFLRA